MKHRSLFALFTFALVLAAAALNGAPAFAQATANLHGQVADPSGAVIPGATITVTNAAGKEAGTALSDASGQYTVRGLAAGTYTVSVTAGGFSPYQSTAITIANGQARRLDIALTIQVEQQQVVVNNESPTVSTASDANANSLVLKDKDLEELSDDPDELQAELSALAGPSAGPNGGQIYIDGFTAGQLPPKSAIREIRINQNPFSAEYDKLGFGRIEILTKPGSEKLHGQFFVSGNDSAFNSPNPYAKSIPPYYTVQYDGNVSSRLTKNSSMFLDFDRRNIQDNSIVNAYVLGGGDCSLDYNLSPSATPVNCTQAVPNPRTRTNVSPRVDFALGKNNTLTLRYQYWNNNAQGEGPGQLSLASTAFNDDETENTAQISDTQVISDKIVNETRFQYIHNRETIAPQSASPTLQVQGSFTGGGYSSQQSIDNTNRYELQNYTSVALSNHFVKFGMRLRDTRDANQSNANFNGYFTFQSLAAYQAAANAAQGGNVAITPGTGPSQYTVTIGDQHAQVNLFDIGLYGEDDWKVKPNFTVSYGLRYESQNQISDHADFAPRISGAYGISRNKKPPKTVIRAGFGMFYDRFQVAQVLQAARQNGNPGTGQVQYVFQNPGFYCNTSCGLFNNAGVASTPTVYQIDRNLRAPYTMQTAIGVEQQVGKNATVSATYVNSRGDHQLLTINANAPLIGPGTPNTGLRPDPAAGNLYRYISEGVFKQNQLILNFNLRASRALTLFGFYQLGYANSDTGGVTTFPTDSYDIGLDYGRASFDVRHRLFLGETYATPRWGFRISSFMVTSTGSPYNITVPQDANQDSIFNDRPTITTASNPNAIKYGSLYLNPTPATGEQVLPINYGHAPGQFTMMARLSKSIPFGPEVKGGGAGEGSFAGVRGGGGGHGGGGAPGGGLGPGGLSGNRGGPGGMGGRTSRRYNLTLNLSVRNLFNDVNPAPPQGTIGSPFFGRSNGLGGAFGGVSQSANRRIDLQAVFSF